MNISEYPKRVATAVTVLLMLGASAAGAAQFKIATIAPDGSQWMEDLREAGREIRSRTDGRVTLKFYAGGVMGNEKKVLRKIRIGQLHGGVFTATGISERYSDMLIYGLPLVFESADEVQWVREVMDPVLIEGLEEAGFVSFGFATGGFAKIMGETPVRSLDDLRGRKIWVPEGDQTSHAAMEALDLSPVVLPITDVLTGLQTGLLEFIATPPVGAVVLQWYTKVSYITDLPLSYSVGTLVVDERAFARLSESDRAVFREVMTRTYDAADRRGERDDAEAQAALEANGLEVVVPDDAEVERMRALTAAANRQMAADGVFSADVFAQMLERIEAYRSGEAPSKTSASSPE